jgi:hypothetical protein
VHVGGAGKNNFENHKSSQEEEEAHAYNQASEYNGVHSSLLLNGVLFRPLSHPVSCSELQHGATSTEKEEHDESPEAVREAEHVNVVHERDSSSNSFFLHDEIKGLKFFLVSWSMVLNSV